MAIDGLIIWLYLPVLLVTTGLVVFYLFANKNSAFQQPLLSPINIRRFLLGVTGAVLGLIIVALFLTVSKQASPLSYLVQTWLYNYTVVFIVFTITLPVAFIIFLGVAHRFTASILSLLITGALLCVLLTILTVSLAANAWCSENISTCFMHKVFSLFLQSLPVVFGFGLLAKLPACR